MDDNTYYTETIISLWGEDGKRVVEATKSITLFNDTFDHFLDQCLACGGNLTGMMLTGIKKLWPTVYDAIPMVMGYDEGGFDALTGISCTLGLCGVRFSSDIDWE